MRNPLKQGLKLRTLIHDNTILSQIAMRNPLKQGLKQTYPLSRVRRIIIAMRNPLKQGLKQP